MNSPDGLLLLHKQPGLTSFDCIRDLKRLWGRKDLGHGGTLDKFASGVLPIFAGEALKLSRFFLENYPTLPTYWKTYQGTFEFGVATETADPEGAIVERREPRNLTVSAVQEAMNAFVNVPYQQMPPKYSAKKIAGARASDLVREGKEVELKRVPVTLRSFVCTGVDGHNVHFETTCSKGTYIRSLALDLAERLDTVAYVKELRRTAVGNFTIENAKTLEELRSIAEESALLGLGAATSFLPRFDLIAGEIEQLRVGRVDLISTRLSNSGFEPGVYCAFSESNPVALFEKSSDKTGKFIRAFVSN